MNPEHPIHASNLIYTEIILISPFLIGYAVYIIAIFMSNKRFKKWPIYRFILFTLGILCAILAVAGPVARQAHTDFQVHMITHLLLGMLAPLLIVLSAPMTVIFRSLSTKNAKKLTTILRLRPVQSIHHPVVTAILNMGGLWLLYTTNLYTAMHHHILLYLFIHAHIFIAGYLFTASMIYIDPTPHRLSNIYRSIVLLLALAAHSILAKYIYANPPSGVLQEEAEFGGMLMYYGGDVVDLIIIIILCRHWYTSSRPKLRPIDSIQLSSQ